MVKGKCKECGEVAELIDGICQACWYIAQEAAGAGSDQEEEEF